MRTISLLGILIILFIAATKAPDQTFQQAANEMVSAVTGGTKPVLKILEKTPSPPTVPGTMGMLREQVAKLKGKYRTAEMEKPAPTWVMPPSKLESGPPPARARLPRVEESVLTEPPTRHPAPSLETPAIPAAVEGPVESERDTYEEVAKLLEEAATILNF
ncbi:MAG: hypothetical protein HQ513_14500 [Rhodospirillales bacterium]|nr:hypothetical protein [Rhodospirillales bacterium]